MKDRVLMWLHSLVLRPKEAEEEKGPGFSHIAHALNCSGIPPLSLIIDTCLTTCDVIHTVTILQCFFHTRQMQKIQIVVSDMLSRG